MQEYDEVPEEAPAETTPEVAKTLPEGWPARGVLSVGKLSLRYRAEMPLVLNNISFEVRAGEKVGIVGRTGSGKSSLLLALFRMVLRPAVSPCARPGCSVCNAILRAAINACLMSAIFA